jgi:hypothetical protein
MDKACKKYAREQLRQGCFQPPSFSAHEVRQEDGRKHLSTLQGVEKTVLAFCQDYWLFLKAAASFCQAIVLLLLFRMLGKKVS